MVEQFWKANVQFGYRGLTEQILRAKIAKTPITPRNANLINFFLGVLGVLAVLAQFEVCPAPLAIALQGNYEIRSRWTWRIMGAEAILTGESEAGMRYGWICVLVLILAAGANAQITRTATFENFAPGTFFKPSPIRSVK